MNKEVDVPLFPETSEEINNLLEMLPSVLPSNWKEKEDWLDLISSLANLTDNSFLWLRIFDILDEALQKPANWNTYFPYLQAIQRPVPGTILWKLLRRFRYRKNSLKKLRRVMHSSKIVLDKDNSLIFWPELVYLTKCISASSSAFFSPAQKTFAKAFGTGLLWEMYQSPTACCCPLRLTPRSVLDVEKWGYRPREEISFFKSLISYQAHEFPPMRELAESTSRKHHCVVLTLHNASIATSSGWSIPDFEVQISNEETFSQFVCGVEKKRLYYEKALEKSRQLEVLKDLWTERIVRPKVLLLLYQMKNSFRIKDSLVGKTQQSWAALIRYQQKWCILDDRHEQYALCPVHWSVSRTFIREFSAWADRMISTWLRWHSLLMAILDVGNSFIEAGKCEYLVVPWINKFYMSSLRSRDTDFLETLLNLLYGNIRNLKIIFVDDTTRRSNPSLKLALDKLKRRVPERKIVGVGIYAEKASQFDCEKPDDLLRELPSMWDILVVRPFLSTISNYRSLSELLRGKRYSFLHRDNYDTSWKDNLDFLYWGTSAFNLTNSTAFDATFPPIVATKKSLLPFGIFYKLLLLQNAFSSQEVTKKRSKIFHEYAQGANLF